ncbi:hypothetical protein Pedsa_1743 [Pseudopedobacter saltans DSM 12145]|uniref:Haloacid dehalogenase n=1 Tax=Pseudopedobacter saltans (strain ATCC 51119 / DSM 12145 / JCM 21818 / CCUG 39354 / LMG 10337 / NBRC 100064 / NCIMB 13643) TaxID=762903 RepID=F0S7P0_PSESL|nr:HAD hydrolase-like protein [Pseudopedobacter saltans]ADY52300.1 hypothetical protein Pedsa_1743 [Pseudopedobacter saltans DSM 12145]
MISYSNLPEGKNAVIFELDDVLFPERDYDLQFFYLFANFLEYVEQFPPAQDLISFMSKRYEVHGKDNMFEELSGTFGVDPKYRENYQRLYENAKLPLKLLLYKEALEFMQELVTNRKQLFILTKGNPKTQFNKITQVEWNGLEKYLKVYYVDEFEGDFHKALTVLIAQNNLQKSELTIVSKAKDEEQANLFGVSFVCVNN